MREEQRKQRFVNLLGELLTECNGVKGVLAQKLNIKPSTLTPWLQGKIDPISLDLAVFLRLASVALRSTDELAQLLGILDNSEEIDLSRFQNLVKELLSSQSQKQLGQKLGVSHNTISGWISTKTDIDPRRLSIGTITALAIERGWTIERLLVYLDLKKIEEIEEDLLAEVQSLTVQLSFSSQVTFLIWFFREFGEKLQNLGLLRESINNQKILSNQKVLIILENDDLALASSYFKNLSIHTQLQLENISVATATKIPETLSDFDLLVVDVTSDESPCISLIEQIEFDGALVVFADSALSEARRDRLSDQVTDLLIKPIPWNELKDKLYFS